MDDSAASSKTARQAAEAAGRAVLVAAENAAKKGSSSSEFKATVLAVLVSGALGGLEVLKHVTGPIGYIAAGIGIAASTWGYQASRGKVKSAALAAAAAAIVAPSVAPATEPTE